MNSFVSTDTAAPAEAGVIPNNGFWPEIDLADFRAQHRLDGTVTAERLEHAAIAAVASANRTLRHWQAQQTQADRPTLDDVPVPVWQTPGVYAQLYRRAVYALAHASLVERYADYDATQSGLERADALAPADAYRRDAAWAISEIEDRPHTTVELI